MRTELATIDNWKACVFRSPFGQEHYWVVVNERLNYVAFRERYDDSPMSHEAQYKQCDGADFDNEYPFFAVWVDGCFDPPIAIVRAENEQDAIDVAVDAFHWLRVQPENYGTPAEFEEACESGIVGFADGGAYYDAEQMNVQPVKLLRVEME